MLPEDDQSASKRAGEAGAEGASGAPGAEEVSAPSGRNDEIRIDGKIGTDPEELKRWAAHVVAGKPIEHMEIADLRALIEAIQAHPAATLAPPMTRDAPIAQWHGQNHTVLDVRGGRVLKCACQELNVRVVLRIRTTFAMTVELDRSVFSARASFHGTRFEQTATFYFATFAHNASFDDTIFANGALFHDSRFDDDGGFRNACFGSVARFCGAHFAGIADFDRTRFAFIADFRKACFKTVVSFSESAFTLPGEVSFVETQFAGWTQFERARVSAGANFGGAIFEGGVSFEHTTFGDGALFREALFSVRTRFGLASFAGSAAFESASFAGPALFFGTRFGGRSVFDGARFEGPALFSCSTFGGTASFASVSFADIAIFGNATDAERDEYVGSEFGLVAQQTRRGAVFADVANFTGARFFRSARLSDMVFFGDFRADGMCTREGASFGNTIFQRLTTGDLRAAEVRGARAALISTRRRHSPWVVIGAWQERESRLASLIAAHQESPWEKLDPVPGVLYRTCRAIVRPLVVLCELWPLHRENQAYWRVLRQMARSRVAHGAVGWNLVRALGRLSILNRVSLVALIAVPVLAAAYAAAQKIVAGPSGAAAPVWIRWLARVIGGSPHLSETLALTFFASVLVTIGLLIYQSFAPDTIKQRDEDEHVRELETRYSDENPSLRGDGLRRSIERLEDQAKVRPNRHPSFVKHHGDLIWIPPRDKPEWFRDDDLEEDVFRRMIRDQLRGSPAPVDDDLSDADVSFELDIQRMARSVPAVPPKQRSGFVPASERARICIEEGARAEYWLKSHEKIGWAWVSLVCYLMGIAILLVILFIQCRSVAKAAWWPDKTTDTSTG